MLLHRMTLISFLLFRKNLGNLPEFFRQIVYRPPGKKLPVSTYIDQESDRDKRFGELPVIPLSKTIYRYLKKEEKRIVIVIKMMMMMMMTITALNIFGITECF